MTETVTVVYFNHRLKKPERVERGVPDLEQPTIEAMVDLIDSQYGTVLTVHHHDRLVHRSVAQLSDFMK